MLHYLPDVCGFFVTLYENPLVFKPGTLQRELILVLEDRSSVGLVCFSALVIDSLLFLSASLLLVFIFVVKIY